MHGIEEELGRPVYGLADYFFRTVPLVGTAWSRAGGVPAHPTTPTGSSTTSGSWRSSSPKGPRDRRRPTPTGTGCAGSGGAASSRSPCGPGCRSCRSPCVGAEESMPILFRLPSAGQGARRAVLPGDRQHAPARPARRLGLLPGQVQAPGPRPGHLRRAEPARSGTRRAGSWTRPRTSGPSCRRPSTTCCATGAASGSAEPDGTAGC